MSKLRTGQVILAMENSGLPERLGFKNALHYFNLAGARYVEARECRRVARGCERLPILREAAHEGSVGWTQLREVVRVASPETEADWVEKCQRHTSKQIQEMVKGAKGGKTPSLMEPGPVRLRMTLSAELNALLGQVTRELSERAGRSLSLRDVVECLLAQHLTGEPFPEEEQWRSLLHEAGAVTEVRGLDGPARQAVEPVPTPESPPSHGRLIELLDANIFDTPDDEFAELEAVEEDVRVRRPVSGSLTAAAMLGWSGGDYSRELFGSGR